MRGAVALAMVLAVALSGCTTPPPDDGHRVEPPFPVLGACGASDPVRTLLWNNPIVRFETPQGRFDVEIFQEQVPRTASNFLNLARAGLYNGTLFHRIINGFVIQGGDPLSRDADPSNDGSGGSGLPIADEFHPDLLHDDEGVLSMANSGPDTGSSQFFITLAATPSLDHRHAIFGRVCEGIEVVRKLGNLTTDGATGRPHSPPPMSLAVLFQQPAAAYSAVRNLTLKQYWSEPIRGGAVEASPPLGANETSRRYCSAVTAENTTSCPRVLWWPMAVTNSGNVRTVARVALEMPADFLAFVGEDNTGEPGPPKVTEVSNVTSLDVEVPAGQVRTFIVGALTDLENVTSGAYFATLSAKAREEPAVQAVLALPFEVEKLGEAVDAESLLVFDYVIYLPNGLLVDTSIADIANDASIPKYRQFFSLRDGYAPVGMRIDGRSPVPPLYTPIAGIVDAGIQNGVPMRAGETIVVQLAAADAYGVFKPQRPQTLQGLDVVFVVTIRETRAAPEQ